MADQKILVMTCFQCGAEIDRTGPLDEAERTRARIAAGLLRNPCPRGCLPTFSDCNWKINMREVSVNG